MNNGFRFKIRAGPIESFDLAKLYKNPHIYKRYPIFMHYFAKISAKQRITDIIA